MSGALAAGGPTAGEQTSGDQPIGDPERRLFLIDGMPIVYQAYFVFLSNPRLTSRGVNTSAAFGYTNSLVKIMEEERPTHMAVVFDGPGRNRRHAEYGQYKAQREKAPEEMLQSLDDVRAITAALRIPEITWIGAEADDVIGTIAVRAESAGFRTVLVTPDKDLAQLVTDRTTLYRLSRTPGSPPSIYGPAEVRERWGIAEVGQVVDVLALVGDSVDNIPGVPGIGDKTAQKLLARFGTVESLVAGAGGLKGKQRERIEQYGEQALLSKRLATIDVDVPVEFDLDRFARLDPDVDATIAIFDRLEFRLLKERLFGAGAADAPGPRGMATIDDTGHDYRVAATAPERQALAAELIEQEEVAIALQSTMDDPKRAAIVGVAFSAAPHAAVWAPFPADQAGYRQALDDLRPVFESETVAKVGHHLKHAMSVLAWHGAALRGAVRDTYVMHSLIDQDGRHRLDQLAERYLGYSPIPFSSLVGEEGKDQLPLLQVDPQRLADYAAESADAALRLQTALAAELADAEYEGVCRDIESPLIGVLVDMECAGVTVDVDVLRDYADQLGAEVAGLERSIYQAAGGEFNLNSPKQLGEILFDRLQIDPNPKKTRTGQYMTNEQQLSRYADRHPMIPLLLDYRIVQKLKSTYVDTLPAAVFERTGRIHTTFNQLAAATGRLNSEGPNLQNIPIRTAKGREIRRAFVPRGPGYLLLSADYSQIELRILASIADEESMLEDLSTDVDIHAATASRVYGVPLDQVTPEMRSKSKMVNYGIAYGMSSFGLSQRLRIARKEAGEIIARYFEQYPKIRSYMDEAIAFAHASEYVQTLKGRRRFLRDINSRNRTARAAAERIAINAPIQGTAADMIKIAMIDIARELTRRGLRTQMILQVHDELVFDLHRDEREEVVPLVRGLMRDALPLAAPIEVEIGVGEDWLSAH